MTTRVNYTAVLSNGLYTVPFPYLDKAHVKVQVAGADVPASAYTWETSGSIRLPAAIGAAIEIFRDTPESPITVYQAGATLTEEDLQADSLQALYRIAEVEDDLAADAVSADEVQALIEQAGIIGADQFIRGDLASSLETKGAALVAWKQADATGVAGLVRDELRRIVRPEHFGATGNGTTDDAAAFQLALNAAAGKTLKLTHGKTYRIASGLKVSSFTTIDARGATVKRMGAVGVMLQNNTVGTTGAYDANEGITIVGGTWDGNYPTDASPTVIMGFTHTRRIKIRDARLVNASANHHIEVNACADVIIFGNSITGGAEQSDSTMEAIQIDGAIGSAEWGIGPYDNTFCSNVKVIGNTFSQVGTGVGTHSAVAGHLHNNIVVVGNTFSEVYFCGVRAMNWESSVIANNVFYRGFHAIRVQASDTNTASGLSITGNQIWQCGYSSQGGAGNGHAIYLFGVADKSAMVTNYAITGNVIRKHKQTYSGDGIKVNYCSSGTINDNMIDETTGNGIDLFDAGGAIINGNRVVNQTSGVASIGITSLTAVSILNNQCDTIAYTNATKSLVMNNNVFNAGGITASGTNTNTTAKNNLVNTTFA